MALVEQSLLPTAPELIAASLPQTLESFTVNGFTTLKVAEGEETWVRGANQMRAFNEYPPWMVTLGSGGFYSKRASKFF
jgi:hypothetical protein